MEIGEDKNDKIVIDKNRLGILVSYVSANCFRFTGIISAFRHPD